LISEKIFYLFRRNQNIIRVRSIRPIKLNFPMKRLPNPGLPVFLIQVIFLLIPLHVFGNPAGWKAGVAKVEITPSEPIWMSGYAGRTSPGEEKLHSLWAKALYLEDAAGNGAVLITMDLALLTKEISDFIKERLRQKYSLDRSRIILSWSHTHTGPLVRDEIFYDFLNVTPHEIAKVEKYTDNLIDNIIAVASEAIESTSAVKISSGNGTARFAVNRRNNAEALLNPATQLSGPVDHSVPVLKVQDMTGELLAVVFGYACHTTTLGNNQWSGDYAGFAQIELEKSFPGSIAMFFAGTGADINPLPRRTVSYARQYGITLAAAVEAVLDEPMNDLESFLVTEYTEINIPFTDPPTIEEIEQLEKGSSIYQQKWASRIKNTLNATGSLPSGYPYYPLQIWRIGQQNLVVLGGEVVIDYTLNLKELLGPDIFVMSYANDQVFYIPSARVLREGGYEGISSIMYTDRPATWKADIEIRIIKGVLDLAGKAGIKLPESRFP
jgi:neutral ceramidase